MRKHIISFEPGHDCIRFECKFGSKKCRPGSGGSHGVSGLNLRFVVKGKEGAVQFSLLTSWLPHPKKYYERKNESPALPADLGYHAPKPQYSEQASMGPCPWLDGKDCYYDGSGLNAEIPFDILCTHGQDALWEYLERYYDCIFRDAKFPENIPSLLKLRTP
jgi:hypothetical protein